MTIYAQYINNKPIRTGCEWRLQFRVKPVTNAFPATAQFTAYIRANNADGDIIAELRTDLGTIRRLDGQTISLVLPDRMSRNWTCDKAVLDIVRTDLTQKIHLGFSLTIPVIKSVTRS